MRMQISFFLIYYLFLNYWLVLPAKDEYVLVYISMEQWDFFNRGAKTCNFCKLNLNDSLINKCACRRPITGQYVTLVIEYFGQKKHLYVLEINVYGSGKIYNQYLLSLNRNVSKSIFVMYRV